MANSICFWLVALQRPAVDEFPDLMAFSSELPQTNMGDHVSRWATPSLSTLQAGIVTALFTISMGALLQTDLSALSSLGSNLVAPIVSLLVINVAASFVFFLLRFMPGTYSTRDPCVPRAMHMCFGLAVLVMVIAGLAKGIALIV